MASGHKHLVSCRCSLPQFKNMDDPPFHKFIVFSVIDDNENIASSYAQCNNCGVIHRITDICRSEIVNREDLMTLPSIDDVRLGMNDQLAATLDRYKADLPTWQAVQYIIDNERWGDFVTLTSDELEGERQVKYIQILGRNIFKIKTHTQGATV